MKSKLLIFSLIITLVALPLVAACAKPAPAPAPAPAPQPAVLNFYSGAPGGSWYPLAVAIGDVWQKNIPDLTITHSPGGGVANVIAVDKGDGDIGITTSVSVGDGLLGNPPFEKTMPNQRTLAGLYPSFLTIAVWKDSGIEKLEDLKGKRLSPGIKGYTSEALTKAVLAAVGLSYDDLKKVEFVADEDAANLMKDGHLDAMTDMSASVKDPSMVELSISREIRILEVPANVLSALQAKSPGLFSAVVPKGSYNGVDADVPIIASRMACIVNPAVDEDLVYQMARTLAENWVSDMQPVSKALAGVQPQDLANECGVEFHPGAAKYYREVGWIK